MRSSPNQSYLVLNLYNSIIISPKGTQYLLQTLQINHNITARESAQLSSTQHHLSYSTLLIKNIIVFYIIQNNMTLNYQAQKKILEPVLKSNTNHYCADCNAASPTWASLDFGVFLCSNCSGAHRALGPTITRVKSATLDLWPQQWVDNMLIGNQELNAYWQSDPRCHEKKPKWGASNQQVARYVYEKYVKRKYVKDPSVPDPLTLYKTNKNKPQFVQREQPPPVVVSTPTPIVQCPPEIAIKEPTDHPDLISFHFDSHPEPHSSGFPQTHLNHHLGIPEQQEPTRSDVPDHGTSFTSQNSENLMTFDEMMNSHNNPSPLMHSLSTQHVPRPTFTVPHIQTNGPQLHPHSNHQAGFAYNQQYQQQQFPQSPQPILHNYQHPQQPYGAHMNGHNLNYGLQGQHQGQNYPQHWQ